MTRQTILDKPVSVASPCRNTVRNAQFRSRIAETGKTKSGKMHARRAGLSEWQVRRVIELIEERLDGAVRVSDLAAAAKLGSSHFTRAFSISLGVSPYAFVMQQRIERARSLLLKSEQEMADIAFACGLADQAHFSRLFRRFVGTTPSKWREQVTSEAAAGERVQLNQPGSVRRS